MVVTGQSLWARRSCFSWATSVLSRETSFFEREETHNSPQSNSLSGAYSSLDYNYKTNWWRVRIVYILWMVFQNQIEARILEFDFFHFPYWYLSVTKIGPDIFLPKRKYLQTCRPPPKTWCSTVYKPPAAWTWRCALSTWTAVPLTHHGWCQLVLIGSQGTGGVNDHDTTEDKLHNKQYPQKGNCVINKLVWCTSFFMFSTDNNYGSTLAVNQHLSQRWAVRIVRATLGSSWDLQSCVLTAPRGAEDFCMS